MNQHLKRTLGLALASVAAGCATLEQPFRSHLDSPAVQVRACADLIERRFELDLAR